MRQTQGAAVALMRVCSQRRNGDLFFFWIYGLLTDYFWCWFLHRQGIKQTWLATDKWEGDWASTDFTSGRIVFSLLLPLSFFFVPADTNWSKAPTLIAPPPLPQKTQECNQTQMTFLLLFRANSRFIIGQVWNRFCWERKVLSPARVADGHVVLLWLYSASFSIREAVG